MRRKITLWGQALRTSFLMLSQKKIRTLSFVCLIALLSLTAGLVGFRFVSQPEDFTPIVVGVLDHEDHQETRLFDVLVQSLGQEEILQIKKLELPAAKTQWEQGKLAAVVVIPKGFFQSILQGENHPIEVYYSQALPLQAGLAKLLLEQALGVLKASQGGIYTTLHYTELYFPQQYQEMFQAVNQRYLNAALSHGDVVAGTVVPLHGTVDSLPFYILSMTVFLLALGLCLFVPVGMENFSPPVLAQLHRRGSSLGVVVAGWTLGLWLWYSLVALLLGAGYTALALVRSYGTLPWHGLLFPALLVVVLCLSSFGVLVGVVFSRKTHAVAVIVLISIVNLLGVGGLIPRRYFPKGLAGLSQFFPGYWMRNLLEHSLLGELSLPALGILLGLTILWGALSLWVLRIFHRRPQEVRYEVS